LAARADSLDAALQAASHTLQQSAKASDRLPELFDQIEQAGAGLKRMADDVARQGNEISRAANSGVQGITEVSNQADYELRVLSTQLQSLMNRLDSLTQEIEQDPSVLLYGRPKQSPGPGE